MLSKMSEAIRSNLTKQQRLKIVALVTIEVHARDILEKLIKSRTADASAFEWLSQLRFYWDRVSVCFVMCSKNTAPPPKKRTSRSPMENEERDHPIPQKP